VERCRPPAQGHLRARAGRAGKSGGVLICNSSERGCPSRSGWQRQGL
jgi:hypothetical protein